MRIIAGEHRGRRLEAPKGQGTRPTTDRVRESLMSALVSQRGTLEDAVVLDAFAGSGALGLEALSRGAARVVFCERDREAQGVIERNIATMKLAPSEARLVRTDVLKRGVPSDGARFDLVFLDPPYALEAAEVFGLLTRLVGHGQLADEVIVAYEHDESANETVDAAAAVAGFQIVSRRHFGDTTLDLMERLCME